MLDDTYRTIDEPRKLTKDFQRFTVMLPESEPIRLYFAARTAGNTVHIKNPTHYDIKYVNKWSTWECDTGNGKPECDVVRSGELRDEGYYEMMPTENTDKDQDKDDDGDKDKDHG